MYRRATSAAGRSAIALVAVYAFLLNTLLSAAAPFVPASSPDAIICIDHAGGAPDQPSGPASAHENSCCVAMCGMGVAALPPSYSSRVSLTRTGILSVAYWAVASVAPSPTLNAQASPRGPPALI